MSEINKRIKYIDIARAFAIIFIVLGHTLVHSNHCSMIFRFLYSFHVVLFFIISGYTFKIKPDETFKDFFIKKFLRIMIPYFIWGVLFLIPYLLFGNDVSSSLNITSNYDAKSLLVNVLYGNGNMQALKQNSSLWFLPALFSMEVFYYYIIKYINKHKNKRFLVLIITIAISYITNYYLNFYLPWGINTVLNLGFFFLIGYLINNDLTSKVISKWYITILLFLVGLITSYFNKTVSCIDYDYGIYTLSLISGLCLSLAFINIAKYINNNKLLEYIGRNTMGILIFHKLIILVFQTKLGFISKLLSSSNIYIELILSLFISFLAIVSSLIAVFIVRKICPILIGEKIIKSR